MLQSIRDKAQGWIAWAIVILISIPFALFGIQEYLGANADPVVAKVDGAKIKQSDLDKRVREARESMRQLLGQNYRPDLFQGDAFQKQVLQAMINETVTRQASDRWNMRVSDAQVSAFIRALPQFQSNGAFSMRLYEAGVRNRGLSTTGFESLVRQELMQQQLQAGVRNTVFVTDSELDEQIRLAQQRRTVAMARIPAADFDKPDAVTDAQARAYYKAHPADYTVPERVKLAYLRIDSAALAPQVDVTDEALKDYFQQHKDEFVVPEERRVRHILIAANADNDAQQKAKAEAILKQLKDGADFAKLAKADSNDQGSAAEGGDLGWVSQGMMVKPFEQAVFSLKPNQLSGLVKTRFGYHIIEVTGVRGGGKADFAEVRPEVEKAYRKQKAEDLYYDKYERLADSVYENPDSLQPAAELLGLKVEHTGWVSRDGTLPDGLENPKVLSAAFSEDVLQNGNNSDVIELAPADAVVIRVSDHEPERVQPFEDVKDKVIAMVAKEQASDKAAEVGRKALQQLNGGESLEALAKQNGWKTEQVEIGRDSRKLPAEAVAEAFSIGLPEKAKRGEGGVVSAEGDYLLIEVSGVTEGDPSKLDAAARQARRAQLQTQEAAAQFAGLVADLRQRTDVTLPEKE